MRLSLTVFETCSIVIFKASGILALTESQDRIRVDLSDLVTMNVYKLLNLTTMKVLLCTLGLLLMVNLRILCKTYFKSHLILILLSLSSQRKHESRFQFHQCFTCSFNMRRSQKCKKTVKLSFNFFSLL